MIEDRSVTATFVKTWVLGLTADPESGGTVTGSGTHDAGTDAAIEAIPSAGYVFIGWEREGVAAPDSPATTVSMTEDRSVAGLFASAELSVVWDVPGNSLTLQWSSGFGFVLEAAPDLSGEPGRFEAVETADGEHTIELDDSPMRFFRLLLMMR